ncbi:hypothetical protein [Nocardia altamirensis]|uniref:hypothetical protein n=1 Tax=Nocardia altamirensis TaxID=472158 RepID=UPI00114C8B4A|nr:hypothetical protein [Nocardia altamirensis]
MLALLRQSILLVADSSSEMPPPVSPATIIVRPPDVYVQPSSSGWAIPLATLIAAVVAGIFLTLNEHLKRKREDRRQWDKEVRDLCVDALRIADELRGLMWDATARVHRFPKPSKFAPIELALRLRHTRPDLPISPEQEYRKSLHPRASQLSEQLHDIFERVNLIGPPGTIEACRSLAEVAQNATDGLHDGIATKQGRRNISYHRSQLVQAVKYDMRIHVTSPENDRVLRAESRLYRVLPQFLKNRLYYRIAKNYKVL